MLPLEEVVEKSLASVTTLKPELIPLRESCRRFAAEEMYAQVSLPGFDNSAMDGFAVVSSDLKQASEPTPVTLRCTGVIPAGSTTEHVVSPGTCMKIFTGSPIPAGADAVIMQEYCQTTESGKSVDCTDQVKPWENIRMTGEDVREGERVLAKGQLLNAGAIGLLAATGHHEIKVGRRPKVALVATGSELEEAPQELAPGKIYDSNRTMLASMISSINGIPKRYPIVRDDLRETCSVLESAFAENDIVLTSGGVSVGDHDHVKPAIKELGGTVGLWKVAIKPGKPFVLGQVNGRPLFGLPGNPASALVTYQLMVRPSLLKMQGATECRSAKRAGILSESFTNKGDRRHFVRVAINPLGQVSSSGGQRSHMLRSLANANALLDLPPESHLTKGESVEVLIIED